MSRILVSLLAGLGLAATALAPASAQSIPPGSYQQSCQNIRVRGDQLTARCTNGQGNWVRSTIALGSCRGDIRNSNGQLTCAGNGYNNGGYNNGGYNNDGNGNGRYNNNGRGHNRDRDRDNGRDRDRDNNNNNNGGYNNGGYNNGGYNNGGYGNRGVPGGSYQSSCTNLQTNGSTLTATCTAPNGQNITSTINAAQCRGGDIANVNGRLACR